MGLSRLQLSEIDLDPIPIDQGAIRWRATSNGKIQIEPKDDLKNRLGRSPDRADAVVLAFSGWAPRKARSTEAVHWG